MERKKKKRNEKKIVKNTGSLRVHDRSNRKGLKKKKTKRKKEKMK